ncbi:hypothetical protein [Burkholderia lata]|uniref:hypothetical protein n=1 Tax=Burkholderia lata (strain ATCC 17760 / DSM 23089 / LMG 22485 / NCIMB 9086 / R18194 / 383) TaxID=482957 RepID=UPI0015818456|nr:hypothetical protein [Burkholderia lata]
MDLTRGDETLDIVRRIHIFSVRCSGFAVRRALGLNEEADQSRRVASFGRFSEVSLSVAYRKIREAESMTRISDRHSISNDGLNARRRAEKGNEAIRSALNGMAVARA